MIAHALRGRTRYPGVIDSKTTLDNRLYFKATAGTTFIGSGTSIGLTIPSTTRQNDLIVAPMFARSAITAPPGYTLVDGQPCGAGDQVSYLYYKLASSEDAGTTLTFTQASSGRMGLGIVIIETPGRGITVEDSAKNQETIIGTLPSVTSSGNGRIVVAMSSDAYANTGGNTTMFFIYDTQWIIGNVISVAENRLAFSVCHVNAGAVPPATIFSSLTTAIANGKISAVFAPN